MKHILQTLVLALAIAAIAQTIALAKTDAPSTKGCNNRHARACGEIHEPGI
ncbi:MAG TPA: hypothetical protein VI754_15720 [Bacteriovoracaceae bacterium]|nr:hypothetical protein [Bacteriovoracaceae bacterium]